jgi:hypothetical protein
MARQRGTIGWRHRTKVSYRFHDSRARPADLIPRLMPRRYPA